MIIKELLQTIPQIGTVEWVSCRPAKRKEVISTLEVVIDEKDGIIGDHYSKKNGNRMVTLIQSEHIQAVSALLNREVLPSDLRRNIVVSGINLQALHNAVFTIGSAKLQGTGHCHPCTRMEENLGPGGYNAMRGHGGITARVLEAGKVKVGDQVKFVSLDTN